jgi:hypothetical protein
VNPGASRLRERFRYIRALAEVVATEIVEPGAVLVTSRRDRLVDSRPSSKEVHATA